MKSRNEVGVSRSRRKKQKKRRTRRPSSVVSIAIAITAYIAVFIAVIVATDGEYSDKEEPKQIEAKDRNSRRRDRGYHHYTSNVTTLTFSPVISCSSANIS